MADRRQGLLRRWLGPDDPDPSSNGQGHYPSGRAAPGMVAAATRIKAGDKHAAALVKRREQWQTECWDTYDVVGEVKYGGNYLGNALSRLGLFVGILPDDADADPIPLVTEPPEGEETAPPNLVDEATFQVCRDALDRVATGAGGHAEILRELAINVSIAGECYLYGRIEGGRAPDPLVIGDPGEPGVEVWDVRSIDEVVVDGEGKIRVYDDPEQASKGSAGGQLVDLDSDDVFLVRIWHRHPRWSSQADSMLRGVLGAAEELLITEQAIRAIARSRLSAGLLMIPEEITFASSNPSRGEDAGSDEDPFLRDLMDAMLLPIQDEGDASAIVPIVVRGKGEHLQQARFLFPDRKLDDQVLERQTAALRRIAQGMNLPVEVITGMADVNHWTAWQIEEATFKAHVEPLAIMLVNAITEGYLRPYLEAVKLDPELIDRLVVWYDPSRLIAKPNTTESAGDAHDRYAISDAAYRRVKGYDDDDAPSEDEIRARVARSAANRSIRAAEEIAGNADPATGEDDPTPDPPEQTEDPSSVTAAASRVPADLGRILRDVDRDLRNRLEAAADAQMRRTLERAGAAIRSKAKRNRSVTDAIEDVDNGQVAATLGQAVVRSLGVEEIDLIETSFDPLEPRFLAWCQAAAEAAVDLVPGMSDDARDEALRRLDEHASEAWRWLRSELIDQAKTLLYDPDPSPPDEGEWDGITVVPYRVVREAVSRAGGLTDHQAATAAATITAASSTALGIASGWLLNRQFEEAGVAREAYEWDYGPYRRTSGFPPHVALDGTVFDAFDEQALANAGSFPPEPYFIPGDHPGCRCDVTPVMVDRQGVPTPEVDVYGEFDETVLDAGLLVPESTAPAASLRRHPAGGYTHVDEAGEGFYVHRVGEVWRIEEQTLDADGVLIATRIGEAGTLSDARRVIGGLTGGTEPGRVLEGVRTF